MKTQHYKLLARTGYYALLMLVPIWHLWISPPALGLNPWLVTLIWFIPLLFPLKGIMQGNPYTFAWSGFLALLYMMHAVVIIYTSYLDGNVNELTMSVLELIFASLFLAGSIYFAKYRGQELGLSIRDKNKKKK